MSTLAFVVFFGLQDASSLAKTMALVDARVLGVTDRAQTSVFSLRRYEKAAFLTIGLPDGQAPYLEQWHAARLNLLAELKELESLSPEPDQTPGEARM